MAKIYTAQEMRDRADYERKVNGNLIAATMLRQAADALDREEKREKKYEYGVLWLYDNTVTNNMGEYRHWAEEIVRGSDPNKCRLARREVGEWEEVRDGE